MKKAAVIILTVIIVLPAPGRAKPVTDTNLREMARTDTDFETLRERPEFKALLGEGEA